MENIQWKKKKNNYSAVEDLNILGSKEAWKLHLQKITPIVSLKK